MFSTLNQYQARKEILYNITWLDKDEKEELAEAEETIVRGSKRDRFSLTRDILVNYNDINKVFKFCMNSDIFKEFCLKNEFAHNETWANILRMLNYPDAELVSLDRKEIIPLFDFYLGAYFYSEYLQYRQGKKEMDPSVAELYLDMACEKGLFKAILDRCESNQRKVKSSLTKNAGLTDALAQIKTDTQRLGNLYWTTGYLHASLILLDVGNYFANQENVKTIVMAQSFQIIAAKKFLQGRELSSYKGLDQNEKIIKDICGEKGLLAFEFNDWDEAQAYFLKHVNSAVTSHDVLIHQAKVAMRKYVNVSRNSPRKGGD